MNFQDHSIGRENLDKTGSLSKLRKWSWKYNQTKAIRVFREESQRGESYTVKEQMESAESPP